MKFLNLVDIQHRGYPVAKNSVNFPFFFSSLGQQFWTPFRHGNVGVFYDDADDLELFLKLLLNRPNIEARLLQIFWLSLAGRRVNIKRSNVFKSLIWEHGLLELVDELNKVKEKIKAETSRRKILELNKKFTVFALELGPRALVELNDPTVREKFSELLHDARNERLYFFLFTQLGSSIPPVIMDELEWQIFLGPENMDFTEVVYPKIEWEIFNENRKVIGLLKDSNREAIIPIHHLKYEASSLRKGLDLVAEAEENAFQKLLENLG